MVCIASNIGRIKADITLLKAVKMPSGIPIARESNTEINTIDMVVIVSGHKSNVPIRKIKKENSSPPYIEVKYHPNTKMMMINTHHGIERSADSSPLIVVEAMTKTKSKNALKFCAKKSMNFSTPLPIGMRILGNSIISLDCSTDSRFLTSFFFRWVNWIKYYYCKAFFTFSATSLGTHVVQISSCSCIHHLAASAGSASASFM